MSKLKKQKQKIRKILYTLQYIKWLMVYIDCMHWARTKHIRFISFKGASGAHSSMVYC